MAFTNASAGQPDHLALGLLNKASVKTGGTWDVFMHRTFEDKYEYQWQGNRWQGTNLITTLVSTEDPRQYCQAQFKKTTQNGVKYQQNLDAYKRGGRFVMSKVAFAEDAKQQYVSAPIKHVVDLSKTKLDACIGAPDSAVQPAPTATVAGSSNLGTNQYFDVTALVQEVQDIRKHENNRSSFVVRIHDGSLDNDTQKVKAMPITVYFDTTPLNTDLSSVEQPASGETLKAFLEEHLKNKTAVSFFCISGAKDFDGKFSFRTTKNTHVAPGVGTKAENLNSDAVLHNLQAADTVAFELQAARSARDWSVEPGRETRCKLLATFAKTATGISKLDEGETFWQLNWVQITEPAEGQNIKNKEGTRLWLLLTVHDDSGSIGLYITEQAVLKLANVVDAAEFEQLHSEARLRFPFWVSVKVLRRPSKPSAVQPGASQASAVGQQHGNDFDCFIVDAAEQNMDEVASIRSIMLLPMLDHSVDSVLPAMLGMVRKSEHYALAVQYTAQEVPPELTKVASKAVLGDPILRPCSRAYMLVLSTKRSKVLDAGASGHKLVTDDVVDFLSNVAVAGQKKYRLTSFCTLDTVTDFKLDPPARAKSQAALISVTGVINDEADSAEQPVTSLLVDNVQHLTPDEADNLKNRLSQMRYFAALAGQVSRKREREPWSPEENPGQALPCRSLGRCPTGPPLPGYSSPP